MSSKTSKRRQKRVNTNDDEIEIIEKKYSPVKKVEVEPSEIIEIMDDSQEGSKEVIEKPEEHNGLKGFLPKDIEANGQTEDTTVKETEEAVKSNGQSESLSETSCTTDAQKSAEDLDCELEPLVLESDNDAELQFPSETGSDISVSETDKSPVLVNRCSTRRSHIKNPPSPRAVKSEVNVPDSKVLTNEVRINITRLDIPDIVVSSPEDGDSSVVSDEDQSEKAENNLTNASIYVNFGNDTTRNLDITTTSNVDDTVPSFVESTKDLSYGETLRNLTGRRTLRTNNYSDSYRSRFCKSSLEQRDQMDGGRKSYVPHISSVKRKVHGESPDEHKRFKSEDSSPGLLSYISSPINTLKNRVSRSDIPSSTPKLTSYKFAHHPAQNIMDEVSNIDLEDEKAESKKWCSIM